MLYFYFKESFNSIRKAKLSFLLSLSITCISVLLVSLCVLLITFSNTIEERFKERITVNVFVDDSLNYDGVIAIQNYLVDMKSVKTVKYVSKEDAARIFIEQTGSDFRNLLDYNPLPSSFEVKLRSEYVSEESIQRIERSLKKLHGVNDVIIQSSIVQKIINSLRAFKNYIFIISIFFTLVSVYIVYSTNRLIIHSRIAHLETMKLVGAKISSIKIPLIITGITIGLLASSITAITVKVISILLRKNIDILLLSLFDNFSFYSFIFFSGIIIGLIGSAIATGTISIRINKNNL